MKSDQISCGKQTILHLSAALFVHACCDGQSAFFHFCKHAHYLEESIEEENIKTSLDFPYGYKMTRTDSDGIKHKQILADLLVGKPPPKNMLKRSSGEMSASNSCRWWCLCRPGCELSSPYWS